MMRDAFLGQGLADTLAHQDRAELREYLGEPSRFVARTSVNTLRPLHFVVEQQTFVPGHQFQPVGVGAPIRRYPPLPSRHESTDLLLSLGPASFIVHDFFAAASILRDASTAATATLDRATFAMGRETDNVTPAAEQFARTHGMVGALTIARGIVRRQVKRVLGLGIDVVVDPDDRQYETLLVTVSTDERVETLLAAFEEIASELRRNLAPVHRERLTVDFDFR
jgi:hypothetical protein